jgi:hypothetical protein
MKKVILSIVCVFAVSTIVNATILSERDCAAEAWAAGDEVEAEGGDNEDVYNATDLAYLRCEADQAE